MLSPSIHRDSKVFRSRGACVQSVSTLGRTPVRRGTTSHRHGQLDCILVSDCTGFAALQSAWQKLFDRAASPPQFFQSHTWLETWLETYHADLATDPTRRLAIIAGYSEGDLVMVWPLIETRRFGLTTLSWMGAPASQYGDVLLARTEGSADWLQSGLKFIEKVLRPDLLLLSNVRADSALIEGMGASPFRTLRDECAPFIDLSKFGSMDQFRAAYSKRTRKTRARKRRRYFEHDNAKSAVGCAGSRATHLTKHAIFMKRAWLASRNLSSRALSSGTFDRFLTAAAHNNTTCYRPILSVLSRGNTHDAIELGFISGLTYFSHLAAYALESRSLSAGMLQFEDTVAYCISNGIEKIDLLAPSDAYKLDWTDQSLAVCDYAKPLSFRGAIFASLHGPFVRHCTKTLLRWLPRRLQRRILDLSS